MQLEDGSQLKSGSKEVCRGREGTVEMPSRVFFDLTAGADKIGRLVFELNSSVCPKTCENFRLLCTGEKGFGYKNCLFFRIIPGFVACSGDFETNNKTREGGKSTFNQKYFDDENFTLTHTGRGLLGMDNYGWPNTNSSRFYVTFGETPWMDGYHVIFGKLIDGFDVLDLLEKEGTIEGNGVQKGIPKKEVRVVDCGQLQ